MSEAPVRIIIDARLEPGEWLVASTQPIERAIRKARRDRFLTRVAVWAMLLTQWHMLKYFISVTLHSQ